VVTTLAGSGGYTRMDGTGAGAGFSSPQGVAVDASGSIFVADQGNHRIRKVTPEGVVTTLAGNGSCAATCLPGGFFDGSGTNAMFHDPMGVATDASGAVVVADTNNNRIRKVTPAGEVTTLAGSGLWGSTDGPAAVASFRGPVGVAVGAGGAIFVSDSSRVRKVAPDGTVSSVAGSEPQGILNGIGRDAKFWSPRSLVLDAEGNLVIGDVKFVRKVTFSSCLPGHFCPSFSLVPCPAATWSNSTLATSLEF